jgi:hypothetical protein
MDRGGIDPVAGADVADVRRRGVPPRDVERLFRIGVDVDEVAVPHLDLVELERVDRLQGLLPAAVLHLDLVAVLLAELRQVDVDARAVEHRVGHQVTAEDLAPFHAGLQAGDVRHRRIGIGVLPDGQPLQGQRQPERVQVGVPEAHVVAVEPLVDLGFQGPAEVLVEMAGDEEEDKGQDRGDQDPDRPAPAERFQGVLALPFGSLRIPPLLLGSRESSVQHAASKGPGWGHPPERGCSKASASTALR